MDTLKGYGSGSGSSSEDEEDTKKKEEGLEESTLHLKPGGSGILAKKLELCVASAAPAVQPNSSLDSRRHVDPGAKEVKYNPKYEDLYAPVVGPANPFKTEQEASARNTVTGFVEPAHVNDFQFDLQRKTFHSYGKQIRKMYLFL